MRSSMRSGAAVTPWPGSISIRRKRRSGAEGASALQCGIGERGHRQREGDLAALRAGRSPACAARGQGGVHLDAGAQQQQLAFERAEPKVSASVSMAGGRRHRLARGLVGRANRDVAEARAAARRTPRIRYAWFCSSHDGRDGSWRSYRHHRAGEGRRMRVPVDLHLAGHAVHLQASERRDRGQRREDWKLRRPTLPVKGGAGAVLLAERQRDTVWPCHTSGVERHRDLSCRRPLTTVPLRTAAPARARRQRVRRLHDRVRRVRELRRQVVDPAARRVVRDERERGRR